MNFADFWKAYPHPKNRGSKAQAETLYGRLSITDRTDMLAGLEKYRTYLAETEWQQPMQAQRWLNKRARNWQSWIDAAQGEDADLSQIHRETEALKQRNARRKAAAEEAWRQKYERQFGHRPA